MSAARRLKPYAQLIVAGLIALFGIAVGATALGHAIAPAQVGLWSGPHAFFFGTLDGAIQAHQLPGSTLYLVALMVVALAGLICRELVGFARASLARQSR